MVVHLASMVTPQKSFSRLFDPIHINVLFIRAHDSICCVIKKTHNWKKPVITFATTVLPRLRAFNLLSSSLLCLRSSSSSWSRLLFGWVSQIKMHNESKNKRDPEAGLLNLTRKHPNLHRLLRYLLTVLHHHSAVHLMHLPARLAHFPAHLVRFKIRYFLKE